MPTVAHIVEKLVEDKPFIQEALRRGLINNAALAVDLTPTIEKELKKQVKFSAVNMAIRRLATKLEKTSLQKAKFDASSDINIKSNLIEITLYKQDRSIEQVKKLHNLIDYNKGDFLTITEGLHEVMIITNEKYKKEILELFQPKTVKKVIKDICSLTITISEDSVNALGLFYLITRTLAWENIAIVDMVSTFTETTLILKEEDVPKAFDVLKKLIAKNS